MCFLGPQKHTSPLRSLEKTGVYYFLVLEAGTLQPEMGEAELPAGAPGEGPSPLFRLGGQWAWPGPAAGGVIWSGAASGGLAGQGGAPGEAQAQVSLAVAASLLSLLCAHLASPLLPASLFCLPLARTQVIGFGVCLNPG